MQIAVDSEKFQLAFDSICQTLCPGALSLNVSRLDTGANHRYKAIYEADRNVFRVKRQQSFIREAITGEFDYSPCSGATMEQYPKLMLQSAALPSELLKSVWKEIPRLWAFVTAIDDGVHLVTAVYRGDPFWPCADIEGRDTSNFKSVTELSEALARIQACEGLDVKAYERFCQRFWDLCVLDAAIVPSNCGVAN